MGKLSSADTASHPIYNDSRWTTTEAETQGSNMRTQHLEADPPKSNKKVDLTSFQEVCPQLLKLRLQAKFGGISEGLGERMKTRGRLKNRQVNKTHDSQRAGSGEYKGVCIRTKQRLNYSSQD